MLPMRNASTIRHALGMAVVLTGFLTASVALAVCQPGQIQEANRAYQSAQEFLVNQQWDTAISRLQSIVQVCPEHVEANRGIGTAFVGKGLYAEAVPYFQQVILLRGDDVEAGDYANLGRTYAKLKKYKEARGEYMKAHDALRAFAEANR